MDRNVWSCRVWQARQAGDLTAQDVLTARALLRRVNGAGCCWPSEARIAADAACSTRTVRRTKARLRDLGLISWVAPRRRGSVLREVCRYRLTVPTIKKNLVVRPTDRMAGELIQSSFSCGVCRVSCDVEVTAQSLPSGPIGPLGRRPSCCASCGPADL